MSLSSQRSRLTWQQMKNCPFKPKTRAALLKRKFSSVAENVRKTLGNKQKYDWKREDWAGCVLSLPAQRPEQIIICEKSCHPFTNVQQKGFIKVT